MCSCYASGHLLPSMAAPHTVPTAHDTATSCTEPRALQEGQQLSCHLGAGGAPASSVLHSRKQGRRAVTQNCTALWGAQGPAAAEALNMAPQAGSGRCGQWGSRCARPHCAATWRPRPLTAPGRPRTQRHGGTHRLATEPCSLSPLWCQARRGGLGLCCLVLALDGGKKKKTIMVVHVGT